MLKRIVSLCSAVLCIACAPNIRHSIVHNMAVSGEDLAVEDLQGMVGPMHVKNLTSPVSPTLPPTDSFTPASLPPQGIASRDNPTAHLFDILDSYPKPINFADLESKCKLACLNNDLALLPAPLRLQRRHYIIKHLVCPPQPGVSLLVAHGHPQGRKKRASVHS